MKKGKSALALDYDAYDKGFVDRVQKTATQSAAVVADIVMKLFRPRSVIDIGCGSGSWLRAFTERGVHRVLGYDGSWVPRDSLRIPAKNFVPIDLARAMPTVTGYDLAISLEVAEHLPGAMAERLIDSLTGAAPVVVFSAAIPGQGGTNHINLQWPWYWRALFADRGYLCCDPIRPLVWCDERVDWVYRQNMYVYLSHQAFRAHPDLAKYQVDMNRLETLTVVEERILRGQSTLDAQPLSELMGAVIKKLRRRIYLS